GAGRGRFPRAIRGRAQVVVVDVFVIGAGGDVTVPVAVEVPAGGPLRAGRTCCARGAGCTGRPRRALRPGRPGLTLNPLRPRRPLDAQLTRAPGGTPVTQRPVFARPSGHTRAAHRARRARRPDDPARALRASHARYPRAI